MSTEGRCNCGSIRVRLAEKPESCLLCYCDNCRRSGGPLSANIQVDTKELDIQDPKGYLKKYTDLNTDSGNPVIRNFCGNCGSPLISVLGDSNVGFLKASLFDEIPPPAMEFYTKVKHSWMPDFPGCKKL